MASKNSQTDKPFPRDAEGEASEPADPPTASGEFDSGQDESADSAADPAREVGGPKGPEPTRYGDWEVKGRCSDF